MAAVVGGLPRRSGPDAAVGSPPLSCTAAELGWIHERALDHERRHRDGVHYTPGAVARRLVALAIGDDANARVCDPSVGGGSFLLAAADHLTDLGVDPAEVVEERLFGIDIDPTAVVVANEALARWAAERGAAARPGAGHLIAADTLDVGVHAFADTGVEAFDAVVGNPPFQNQLGRGTARSAGVGADLRERWGVRAGPYADTAAWFLLAGLELAAPDGRIVLVQPQSVLAAADVEPIRRALGDGAVLDGVWWGGTGVFAADVAVCAPVLRRADGRSSGPTPTEVRRWSGPELAPTTSVAAPTAATWAPVVAEFVGAPAVSPLVRGRIADIATATAGFRDEYYAMTAHLRDDPAPSADPRLLTVGMIDTLHDRWGTADFRVAKKRWRAPRVDLAALRAADPRIAGWLDQRLHPKVLVATQTKVIEAVVDDTGDVAPCTPVVAVTAPPDRLWHVEETAQALRSELAEVEGAAGALRAEVSGLERFSSELRVAANAVIDRVRAAAGVETALGAAIGDDLEAGELANNELDDGVVGWTPLPEYEHAPALPMGAEPLSQFVEAPPALARRLSQTGLVDRLMGPRLQSHLQPGQRLVSREGDLWRWDGYAAAAGAAPSGAALRLERLNALDEARTRLEHAAAAAEQVKARYDAAAAQAEETRRRHEAAEQARKAADRRATEAETASGKSSAEAAALAGRIQSAEDLLAARKRDAAAAETARAEAAAELEVFEAAAAQGDDAEGALNAARSAVEQARSALIAAKSAREGLERRRVAQAERKTALERDQADWQRRLDAAAEQVEALAERQEEAAMELESAEAAPLEIEERRAELGQQAEEAQNRLAGAVDALAKVEAELKEVSQAEKAAATLLAEAREGRARLEARAEASEIRAKELSAEFAGSRGLRARSVS